MQKIKLEGGFGNKELFLEIGKTEKINNNVVINIHGAFGEINEKYKKFGNNLLENNNSNIVLYSSTRLDNIFENLELSEFEKKQKLFEGKILQDEIEDGKIVVNYILENSEKLFGIKIEDLILTINGNSLGGIIALELANIFSEIKNINIVGTGANLDIKGTSLLNSYPDLISLAQLLEKFKGNILLNYATQDIVFTEKSFYLFYDLLKNANKSKIKFIGVDHSFKKINGEKSEIPYNYIYKNIVELLNGNLISGEKDFLNINKKENIKIDDKLLKKYFKEDKDGFWE
ncbi:MAG: hypothetical protein Q9M94_00070 [Candidatus Gracilibacteria bacterium]|nr:hypothetical protein [Candidatus Gracilibacteria bacterium]MDQ7023213.1 hypothetical protein [Candidatus Gracilibacteria bacterium]